MPSKSPAQHRFMAAVANNPSFAKKVGVPPSVGKEFVRADKAKGYSTKAKINRADTRHGSIDMPYASLIKHIGRKEGGPVKESKSMMKKEVGFMKKAGAPKSMIKHEMAEMKGGKYARGGGIERRGKTKGTMVKMNRGGRAC
jgi:hypothetical protein